MSFRKNFPFRVYITNKLVAELCSKTFCMVNKISYIRRVATKNQEPIQKTHRNIILDNWFFSVPLTNTGRNIQKNKVEVPPKFLKRKSPIVIITYNETKVIRRK